MSVNTKPDHPSGLPPGDSHILVAPGVGVFAPLSGSGVLNQNKNLIILKKKGDFCFVT